MKSRSSYYNPGVARSLLRRYWPLWTAYAVILLLNLPLSLATYRAVGDAVSASSEAYAVTRDYLAQSISGSSSGLLFWSALFGLLIAGAVFGHLFNNRLNGLMNSLPLRREGLFLTAWLTGLVPMLLADLLAVLLGWLMLRAWGLSANEALLRWLGMAVLANLAFFNFCVFCAVLVGRKGSYVLLFLLSNVAVGLLTAFVLVLLEAMLYGYVADFPDWAAFLTPPLKLVSVYGGLGYLAVFPEKQAHSLATIAIYAGVSVLFLLAGLLCYRRRQMETVGDAVSAPWLKPILKTLFCLTFALGFTLLLMGLTGGAAFDYGMLGVPALLGCLLPSVFLGYFLAEMIVRRTVKVFRGAWRGFFITAGVLAVLACAVGFDVFGYETRVPAAEEIREVRLSGHADGLLTEPELVDRALSLHRGCVALRDQDVEWESYYTETIRYELKNGRTIRRQYRIDETMNRELEALCNEPASISARMRTLRDQIDEESFNSATLIAYDRSGSKYAKYDDLSLDELLSLMDGGVLPDAALGQIDLCGEDVPRGTTEYTIQIFLKDELTQQIEVDKVSENTLRWIKAYLRRSAGDSQTGQL